MHKRSLTLLETLIALVLLVAMAALIVPSMLNSMEERTFESAADLTNEQLMMARAHAQATGSPVEVTYRAGSSKVEARLFMPWLTGMQSGSGFGKPEGAEQHTRVQPGDERRMSDSPSGIADLGPLGPERPDQSASENLIPESWASRELAHGLRMVTRPPDDAAASASRSSNDESNASSHDEQDGQSLEDLRTGGQDIRLAVFMPDGSALLGDPVWLNDENGRCGVLTVNPWSGLPVFQRLANRGDHPIQSDREKTGGSDSVGTSPENEANHARAKDRGSNPSTTDFEDVRPIGRD